MQVTNASGDMGLDASAAMRRMKNMSEAEQAAEAAGQFEKIFIRQFLGESMKPMISGCLGGDMPGGEIYRSLMIDTLADGIQNGGGMGLSNIIQLQLQKPAARGTAQDADDNA
jgi:Rod binding domain-containing protein